jgi:hypothetical protein
VPKHTNEFDKILVLVIFRLFCTVGIPDLELAKVRRRAIKGLENFYIVYEGTASPSLKIPSFHYLDNTLHRELLHVVQVFNLGPHTVPFFSGYRHVG